MNLPNKLTILRILLIPVFIVFASLPYMPGGMWAACAVFSFACLTDYLDGHIARKRGLVTDFGKFADPLADKILTTVAFLYMMQAGACHPLVLVIVLTREFAVSGVRMVAAGAPGGVVIAANMWGKVKTVLQMVVVILYYFAAGFVRVLSSRLAASADISAWRAWPQIGAWWLCWAVAAITAVSGVQYIWSNRRFINTAQ